MRALFGFLLTCLLFAHLSAYGAESSMSWERTTWEGEPAWQSTTRELRAIVSEKRCRLIYFGPIDGAQNLLSAPKTADEPTAANTSPNWGGHRFWLGPQSRWGWPPPRDWEHASAKHAAVEGKSLFLTHPHSDPAYPELRREYAWDENRLRCTVSWKAGAAPFYGMHVIAVDTPAAIEATLFPWEKVPLGAVGIRGDQPNTIDPLPHPAVEVSGSTATAQSGRAVGKLGFYPQPLRTRRGSFVLIVHPGPISGAPLEAPDHGYISQLWVGDARYTYAELEQLTPFILPDPAGGASSTIYLEAKNGPAH